jgi:hypothetical protein
MKPMPTMSATIWTDIEQAAVSLIRDHATWSDRKLARELRDTYRQYLTPKDCDDMVALARKSFATEKGK